MTRSEMLLANDLSPHRFANPVNTAAGQIRSQAQVAARVGQLDQGRTLDRIAERTVRTPGGKENSFGLAVTQLLKHFSLPDSDIVDAHYLNNPRSDGIQTWSDVLSKYRGAPYILGFTTSQKTSTTLMIL